MLVTGGKIGKRPLRSGKQDKDRGPSRLLSRWIFEDYTTTLPIWRRSLFIRFVPQTLHEWWIENCPLAFDNTVEHEGLKYLGARPIQLEHARFSNLWTIQHYGFDDGVHEVQFGRGVLKMVLETFCKLSFNIQLGLNSACKISTDNHTWISFTVCSGI